MKIVMLEPLGVSEEKVMKMAKPFLDAGHEFVYCGKPVGSEEEKKELAREADVFIIANSPLSAGVIDAAPNLKMISVGFTGVDHVDMETCRKRGVVVCNAQGYATDATAEMTLTMMLACLRNVVPYDGIVREGGRLQGFSHNTLKGKTVGIVGTGAIGRRVAELVKAFGCNLLGYDVAKSPEAMELGVTYAELDELFAKSDIVTMHAPLLESTRKLASRERIALMKKTAILINCARGPLVDSEALAEALNEGRIAKAGIDVYEMEPPIPADHPLLHAKNVILTPHVAFYTEESLALRVGIVCDNISAWMAGRPINVK